MIEFIRALQSADQQDIHGLAQACELGVIVQDDSFWR